MLDLSTVAAGGGSLLTFRNGLFQAGPHSAGAEPGPASYMKGGPLAVTDANLILGRLFPDYFPKVSHIVSLPTLASLGLTLYLHPQLDLRQDRGSTSRSRSVRQGFRGTSQRNQRLQRLSRYRQGSISG